MFLILILIPWMWSIPYPGVPPEHLGSLFFPLFYNYKMVYLNVGLLKSLFMSHWWVFESDISFFNSEKNIYFFLIYLCYLLCSLFLDYLLVWLSKLLIFFSCIVYSFYSWFSWQISLMSSSSHSIDIFISAEIFSVSMSSYCFDGTFL